MLYISSDSSLLFTYYFFSVIFALEAPHSFICGSLLAVGNLGPYLMPVSWHLTLTNVMTGMCVFSTVIFSLYLYEESRHLQLRVPRRSIWAQYPCILLTCSVVFVSSDFVGIFLLMAGVADKEIWDMVLIVMFATLFAPIQLAVAVYFFRQVQRYFKNSISLFRCNFFL